MDVLDIATTILGMVLLVVVAVELLLAVLHVDANGFVARRLQRGIWRVALALVRSWPRRRRTTLALAGPLMIVATFGTWVGIFVLGFALIYWPHLESFQVEAGAADLAFADAVAFSLGTGSVLGLGDILPARRSLRILASVQAGIGFALFTGLVTYLHSIVAGVGQRHALTTRLYAETAACGGDAAATLGRWLRIEGTEPARQRLRDVVTDVHVLQERMHQFPILDLYYRSRNPARDPEHLLVRIVDLALAANIVALDDGRAQLRPVAEELETAAVRTMRIMASEHLGPDVGHALAEPRVGPEDVATVAEVAERIADTGGRPFARAAGGGDQRLVDLAARARIFFAALEDCTGWRGAS